jgi:hypothetical protein
VLHREVGPFPCCTTPYHIYSAPGVEPEEFKLLKGRSSGSGVMFAVSVSVTLVLTELVHPAAPCPIFPLASACYLPSRSPLFSFFWGWFDGQLLFFFWLVLRRNALRRGGDSFRCCILAFRYNRIAFLPHSDIIGSPGGNYIPMLNVQYVKDFVDRHKFYFEAAAQVIVERQMRCNMRL